MHLANFVPTATHSGAGTGGEGTGDFGSVPRATSALGALLVIRSSRSRCAADHAAAITPHLVRVRVRVGVRVRVRLRVRVRVRVS